MGIVIPSQIEKKELDKNAKKIKRKKGQYAQQRLFFKPRTNLDGRKRYKWGTNKYYKFQVKIFGMSIT